MFGLSTRERLQKTITEVALQNTKAYKQTIVNSLRKLETMPEIEANKTLLAIRRDYLDLVANTVINGLRDASPKIFMRIQLNFLSPSKCGYDDLDLENGISGGALYAICYNAITGKIANPKDCIFMNHVVHEIMEDVLREIDSEYS